MNKGIFYDLPDKYKYSIAFENKVIPLESQEAEKYLSLASKENLKQYLPKNINLGEKVDCLAIAGQSFIANKLNRNDDGVDAESAIRIAKLFPYTYIDALHRRDTIIGVILNASFADVETHEELTEEQVKTYTKPFACTIGGIIWKAANKKFAEALKNDKLKDSLYMSWELGFNEWALIELPKNEIDFDKGEIVGDNRSDAEVQKLNETLKCNGGSGILENGKKVGRVITGDCYPFGIGLVTNPAGQLESIVIGNQEDIQENIEKHEEEDKEDDNKNHEDEHEDKEEEGQENPVISTQSSVELLAASTKNFTNSENGVKQNIQVNQDTKVMEKITKIEDINDNSLKECKASAIVEFINDKVKEANDKFIAEENKAKNAEKSLADTQKELSEVKANLAKLTNEIAQKQAEETFNQRMAYFDDTYELFKDERQTIAEEISVEKNIDKDAFEKIKAKYDIFLKGKSKADIQAKKEAAAALEAEEAEAAKNPKVKKDKDGKPIKDKNGKHVMMTEEEMEKHSKASTDTTPAGTDPNGEAVKDALNNGKSTTPVIPNAAAPETSFADKYAEAFKVENCIEIRKV